MVLFNFMAVFVLEFVGAIHNRGGLVTHSGVVRKEFVGDNVTVEVKGVGDLVQHTGSMDLQSQQQPMASIAMRKEHVVDDYTAEVNDAGDSSQHTMSMLSQSKKQPMASFSISSDGKTEEVSTEKSFTQREVTGVGDAIDQKVITDATWSTRDSSQSASQVPYFIWLKEAMRTPWVSLFTVVVILMFLDALVAKRLPTGSFKVHIAMVLAWIGCGFGYCAFYFYRYGKADGEDWFIGYVLEWMLSMDNLFTFHLLFRAYNAPSRVQEKVVFYGVLGSIVTRGMLFSSLAYVLKALQYCQICLGVFLIYTGIQALRDDGDESGDNAVFRFLKNTMGTRLKESWDSDNYRFFLADSEDGRWVATLMVPLTAGVITLDVIFAVDSVSAKLAQISNPYIAYSSSVFAILGLRAMFFVIDDLVKLFELLKYGVCAILIFIGVELMFVGRIKFPEWVVLAFIAAVLTVCIVGSAYKETFQNMWHRCTSTMKSTTGITAQPHVDERREEIPVPSGN
jgi:tellurite resistance protein TerC